MRNSSLAFSRAHLREEHSHLRKPAMSWTPLAPRRQRKPAIPEAMNWALELGFRPITINHMHVAGIRTREQLCATTVRNLRAIPTMSAMQLKKVKRTLGPDAAPELDLPFWVPPTRDGD
jgi:hypothetical protein